MNKAMPILSIFALPLALTACSSSAPTAEYPYDFVGLYDNITRQHIEIGDSKDRVEKIFGSGDPNDYDSSIFEYNDNLTVGYDGNNVKWIQVSYWGDSYFDSDQPYRYELPNNINTESIVTDFIDSFPYVYELSDEYSHEAVTYVEETPDGYISLSKEYLYEKQTECENIQKDDSLTDEEIDEILYDQTPIYKISIDYSSYENIDYIEIDTINEYYALMTENENLKRRLESETPQPAIDIKEGDIISSGSDLVGKTVRVSGYFYHHKAPEYNEKYGYVTYYLSVSDSELVQVNYSGSNAKAIAYETFDILEAEGIVTKVYKVNETILQISAKNIKKIGVVSRPETPSP